MMDGRRRGVRLLALLLRVRRLGQRPRFSPCSRLGFGHFKFPIAYRLLEEDYFPIAYRLLEEGYFPIAWLSVRGVSKNSLNCHPPA